MITHVVFAKLCAVACMTADAGVFVDFYDVCVVFSKVDVRSE